MKRKNLIEIRYSKRCVRYFSREQVRNLFARYEIKHTRKALRNLTREWAMTLAVDMSKECSASQFGRASNYSDPKVAEEAA